MLKLVGTDGSRYYSLLLKPGEYTVGRKSECEFSITNKTISRQHAKIIVSPDGDTITVKDLGSHNGTFVNGCKITESTDIKLNDKILFGSTDFKVVNADDDTQFHAAVSNKTILGDIDPEKSVVLSINEALKPLPAKITEIPDLLPTFFELAKTLVLSEPKEEMLEKSLKMITRVITTERLAILTVSEDQSEVYTEATLLPEGKDPGAFTLSKTIVNEIITNKNAILIGDPTSDDRFANKQSIIMSEMKSAVAVPLFDEGRVLGILYIDTTNPIHVYNDTHMRVLATFGNIIASKLLNYELATERAEKQVLDAELRRASSIQKNLLVPTPPEVPGYAAIAHQEQSRSVGGDLYDMKLLADGRLLFMVADVSGKGMGAALLMSNILAAFRIQYESDNFDLNRAVRQVSSLLFKYTDPGDFATLFIGLVDPQTNKMTYINGGHNPPLLIRTDGSMEHLQPGGIMIGAFDMMTWEEQIVDLSVGDLLFVFSDGVTEADNGEAQYGDERTEKMVLQNMNKSPQEIVNVMMEDINNYMGDAPRSDDITMLVLKRVEA